jgi:hypothetical protein
LEHTLEAHRTCNINILNVHNFKMQRWLEHAGNVYRNAIARPGEIKLENHTGEAPKFSIE